MGCSPCSHNDDATRLESVYDLACNVKEKAIGPRGSLRHALAYLEFQLVITFGQWVCISFHVLQKSSLCWAKSTTIALVLDTLADFPMGKSEMIAVQD